MDSLLQQIKARRQALALKQNDMPMRIGVSRQQYQRLEAKGNPRLGTLELIAKGLNSELLLIPAEKLDAVLAVLRTNPAVNSGASLVGQEPPESKRAISDDPWKGLLGDES
jgi:transcriptional regulator with XRE-family HTH domain